MTVVLHNDDCMNILRDMPDNHVEMVLSDIPYDEVNRASGGLRNLDRGKADIKTFELSDVLPELLRVCSGSIYIFCGFE